MGAGGVRCKKACGESRRGSQLEQHKKLIPFEICQWANGKKSASADVATFDQLMCTEFKSLARLRGPTEVTLRFIFGQERTSFGNALKKKNTHTQKKNL